ncbi:bifunctional folylpolyglutamate synthase/dihydrofolate synthase [Gammaproteobacteria bacterium]|nr:bifunctional folylpolyglutamate synthase/dihydrofolate synthase [Gammaproteobacteria bacterium]
MFKYKTVNEWLSYINSSSPAEINLSLERVYDIGNKLNLLNPNSKIITVAGTNGKGSCVSILESIYLLSGYSVGSFMTPFLFSYNEQFRVNGKYIEDYKLCDAFLKINNACDLNTQLTVFEYGTLAAFIIFKESNLDIWLLEVGLGGRFDAVNAIDSDLAVISSISIDHINWLGNTRDKIGYEKAGVFRKNKLSVCGDFDPPKSLTKYAFDIKTHLFCQNREFGYIDNITSWSWWSGDVKLEYLPKSGLNLQNISTCLMAINLLQLCLPVDKKIILKSLSDLKLTARIQVVYSDVIKIFDVAHNPASVSLLSDYLSKNIISGKTIAIFSILSDKDVLSIINIIKNNINKWYISELNNSRFMPIKKIQQSFKNANIKNVICCDSVKNAYNQALSLTKKGDRVVVFGSFKTVSEAVCKADDTFNALACSSTE